MRDFIIFPWKCHRRYHQKPYSSQELSHLLLLLLSCKPAILSKQEISLLFCYLLLANPYWLSLTTLLFSGYLQIDCLINRSNNFLALNLRSLLYNSLESTLSIGTTISALSQSSGVVILLGDKCWWCMKLWWFTVRRIYVKINISKQDIYNIPSF